MKHLRCAKCEENQRKAGEALGLFNEAAGALLEAEDALRQVLSAWSFISEGDQPHQMRDAMRTVRELLSHAGERRTEENALREIVVRPS